jgi:hypothetical protein
MLSKLRQVKVIQQCAAISPPLNLASAHLRLSLRQQTLEQRPFAVQGIVMSLRLDLQVDSNHSEQGSVLARLIDAARCSVASPFRARERERKALDALTTEV